MAQWQKGQSGNPNGRRRDDQSSPEEVRLELAKEALRDARKSVRWAKKIINDPNSSNEDKHKASKLLCEFAAQFYSPPKKVPPPPPPAPQIDFKSEFERLGTRLERIVNRSLGAIPELLQRIEAAENRPAAARQAPPPPPVAPPPAPPVPVTPDFAAYGIPSHGSRITSIDEVVQGGRVIERNGVKLPQPQKTYAQACEESGAVLPLMNKRPVFFRPQN